MKFSRVLAGVGIALAVSASAACGESEQAPESSVPATSNRNLNAKSSGDESSAVPANFPKNVPVVDGPYREYRTATPGSVGLEVVGAVPASFDKAVGKLGAAGYTMLSEPSEKGAKRRTATFIDDDHRVSVEGQAAGDEYRLVYRVVELDQSIK